jgi:preprotein translocase subunit SecD
MMIRCHRFNIYLFLALALTLAAGCRSPEGRLKRALATLHLHQEITRDPMGRSEVVTVFRDPLVTLNVDKAPFLTEEHVKQAKVIDVLGGFALSVQFDREGTMLLEQYTSAGRGRQIAIFSQFAGPPKQKLNEGRWLAAPKIINHIPDGLLIFTPNTTREEAQQIAVGLNNVSKKLENNTDESKW